MSLEYNCHLLFSRKKLYDSYIRGVYLLIEISSRSEQLFYYQREVMGEGIDQAKWSLLAQKRKFFLNPRRRNDAPTVSNTPPTGNNPIGDNDSIRKATPPTLENIGLSKCRSELQLQHFS